MSEEISALLDGELPEREGFEQIDRLIDNPERQRIWETYGLIGDVMRGHTHAGFASRVCSRIAAEPPKVSPQYRSMRRSSSANAGQKWFVMSAAAVISAIAFVAWVSLPMMTGANQDQIARSAQPGTAAVVAAEAQPDAASTSSQEVGGYIMAHQQFSPSNSIQGVATYVRLVSEDVAGASR